jgi:hypothetical protein
VSYTKVVQARRPPVLLTYVVSELLRETKQNQTKLLKWEETLTFLLLFEIFVVGLKMGNKPLGLQDSEVTNVQGCLKSFE